MNIIQNLFVTNPDITVIDLDFQYDVITNAETFVI